MLRPLPRLSTQKAEGPRRHHIFCMSLLWVLKSKPVKKETIHNQTQKKTNKTYRVKISSLFHLLFDFQCIFFVFSGLLGSFRFVFLGETTHRSPRGYAETGCLDDGHGVLAWRGMGCLRRLGMFQGMNTSGRSRCLRKIFF